MKTWTKQAKERLAEYLEARIRRDGLSGIDAQELKSDLETHIYEEMERSEAQEIESSTLKPVLAELEKGNSCPPQKTQKRHPWLIAFGVVLPACVSIFEMLSGFCGGVFFDPAPTFFHGVLILLVPILNYWLLKYGHQAKAIQQGIAAGVSVMVSSIYALLFLPLLPASVFALIFFGLGLLSLMPLISWFVTRRVSKIAKLRVAEPWDFKQGWRIGALGCLGLFLILESPGTWTRWQLSRAISPNSETAQKGLESLRSYHNQNTLLRACYEGNGGTTMATDISGWLYKGWRLPFMMLTADARPAANSKKARDIFFRATGKPFNSVTPPNVVLQSGFFSGPGNRGTFNDVEFDAHLGGDSVAVRLRDLDLDESRFDGHLDRTSQIGYGEWTMVFRNDSIQAKEARCQVRLPKGGRVSRLTLWVNGEPREAAFSSVEKVKAAYREIAVVQRKDPVLVTMAGPDTIMVQCFPVPAQGEMKIRFGITAPIEDSHWEIPRIIERNFGISADTEHSLWLQSDQAFDISGGVPLAGSTGDGPGFSASTTIPFKKLVNNPLAVRLGDASGSTPTTVWCEDPFAGDYLIRHTEIKNQPKVEHLIVVVDGSASMAPDAWRLEQVLRAHPSAKIFLANDSYKEISSKQLPAIEFSGGRDNEPALRKAVSLAKTSKHSAIVWIHGPQSVELSKPEALLQLLERGSNQPKIYPT